MELIEIRRYPVKSLLGEFLPVAVAGDRGLEGDRLWAVRDADGKFGSGKNTRRFRRMPGLFGLRAYTLGPLHVVELPDGRRFDTEDPGVHPAVSEVLGRPVTLAREAAVPHHDEGPISVITTAGIRALTALTGGGPDGAAVDPQRFRANLLIGTPGTGHPEDDWAGRRLRLGADVILRVMRPLTRCVMIDMPQDAAPARNDLLKTLATHHGMTFGVVATVESPGVLHTGDACTLL
ncbi:molybdenum cofactor biosysynthesis protein [Actinoplanes italicus]|uniref:MOSC domain-containing protein n=1 Tax=Actinoplanes italicus TaxID=113567 RepID=A0A2T0JW99_9ACTN|nr:MOSC domain-containing protein [Actinoplanes italicus]PRX11984.1 hypothetical protein CLV67_1308 [Actinoplanes italicus]GIE30947.1 molybdenum cofactor biosysynthesis protein [Actinoplanes italicus]